MRPCCFGSQAVLAGIPQMPGLFEAPPGDSVILPASRQAKRSRWRDVKPSWAPGTRKNLAGRSSGRTSPIGFRRMLPLGVSCWHRHRERAQRGDPLDDRGKQLARDRDLRDLVGDVPAVADHLRADLDQFLAQRRQRPLGNRLGNRQSPKEVSEALRQHVKLQTYSVRVERATREPRPLDGVLTVFDPLLTGAPLVVKLDDTCRLQA